VPHQGSKRSEEVYKSRSYLEERYDEHNRPVLVLNTPTDGKNMETPAAMRKRPAPQITTT
jgi:hypothetical protein